MRTIQAVFPQLVLAQPRGAEGTGVRAILHHFDQTKVLPGMTIEIPEGYLLLDGYRTATALFLRGETRVPVHVLETDEEVAMHRRGALGRLHTLAEAEAMYRNQWGPEAQRNGLDKIEDYAKRYLSDVFYRREFRERGLGKLEILRAI